MGGGALRGASVPPSPHCPLLTPSPLPPLFDCSLDVTLPQITGLAGLEILELDGCQLAAVPPGLDLLTQLRKLHLTRNHIRELPPELELCTNLQVSGALFL